MFYLENCLRIKQNKEIKPKDVIKFNFPYDISYDENDHTFRIGKKGSCESVDYILVSSFMNLYECSMNQAGIILSIPSYYNGFMKSRIENLLRLCDFKSVDIVTDYEVIGLSYAYYNRETIKETENLVILQIDSISSSSSIIQVNTV